MTTATPHAIAERIAAAVLFSETSPCRIDRLGLDQCWLTQTLLRGGDAYLELRVEIGKGERASYVSMSLCIGNLRWNRFPDADDLDHEARLPQAMKKRADKLRSILKSQIASVDVEAMTNDPGLLAIPARVDDDSTEDDVVCHLLAGAVLARQIADTSGAALLKWARKFPEVDRDEAPVPLSIAVQVVRSTPSGTDRLGVDRRQEEYS